MGVDTTVFHIVLNLSAIYVSVLFFQKAVENCCSTLLVSSRVNVEVTVPFLLSRFYEAEVKAKTGESLGISKYLKQSVRSLDIVLSANCSKHSC